MATNKGTTPTKNTPVSNNSIPYSPKNRRDCVDTNGIKGYKETALSDGGLTSIDGTDPEAGTNCQN